MQKVLKEKVIEKAYSTKNIERSVWDDDSLKLVELNLLGYYKVDGELDEERQMQFIDNILFETDKYKFLKEIYEDFPPQWDELIGEFVECETVNEFINAILDGYGMVLSNEVVIYLNEI
ncbi:hypothetical protein [Mammaliicoccus vitulinus]|uniref:hypothetical protein n=1 Tax=Mammaliicoccus vitulinus TaxID=71237 RepID=UPI00248CD530|nr:hypothetical protein [Mammaliicoccus vitulinus]